MVAVDVGELFNTTGRVVGKERLLFVVAIVMVFCSWICPVPAEKVKVPMEIEPFIMVIPVVVLFNAATLVVDAPVMGPTVLFPFRQRPGTYNRRERRWCRSQKSRQHCLR